jgi:hypothetical protein
MAEDRAAIAPVPSPEALTEMVAVLHVHSSAGDGASSPLDLARAARRDGVDALVLTDHLLERVSYAPWPVGNALGVALSLPSVMTHGLDRYFREAEEAERRTPGLVVLPGFEVTPFARFVGSPWSGSLELQGWHRHLLILGLEDTPALRRLPVAGNRAGGVYNSWSALFLLPAAGFAWAARRLARPAYREATLGAFRLRQRRHPVREVLALLASASALWIGFPFRVEPYSPVGADPGEAPFHALITRVRRLGGITLWAHPEAGADARGPLGIRAVTRPYPDLVRGTDADGFGALSEGLRRLAPPGGIWDQALEDYLRGTRTRLPVAVAELDEHRAVGAIDFRSLQTVCLVRERSRRGLLEAIRSGRIYGRWTPAGKEPLRLALFRIEAAGARAISGGSLVARGPLTIHLGIAGGDGTEVTARLVRRGEVIWTRRGAPPFEDSVPDRVAGPACYRLDVEGAYPYRLIGNPIVVRTPGEGA